MFRKWVIGLVGVAVLTSGIAPLSAQTVEQGPNAEQTRVRQKIFMMEGVLERAVQLGVENLRRRVRAVMPDDALLQGSAPQVRGFWLEGYGVFFDVEVPSLRRSLAWSLRTINDNGAAVARDLAAMRAFMQAIADPRARAEFDRILQRVQRQMGPQPQLAAERVSAQTTASAGVISDPAPAPQPDPAVDDPSDAYTQEVKASLIDAMIENSGALVIGPDEWLTVAARDNAPSDPFMPGGQDATTLVIRIKGSDLSAFRTGQLTLAQVREHVQVGEF